MQQIKFDLNAHVKPFFQFWTVFVILYKDCNKVSSVMGCDDSWPATVPSVVVFSFTFSEAVHTTMYTMKQAVPVECLDWWLFPLIHSLGQLPHFYLNGWSANPETPKMAEPYFQSRI